MLLLLFVVVVLLGQTVWAAGYRPPRTLGDWHHRAALGAPTTPAAAVPSKAAASGSNTAATTAAPQPAKAAAVPPEDADYWQAAKGSKQQPPSASSDAAAATSQQQQQPQQQPDPSIDSSGGVDDDDSVPWKPREADITPQEEAVQLAEAEARAAQDFAAVHSLNGEEEQEEEQLVDAAAAAAAGGDAAQQPPQQQLPGATTAASTPAAVPAGNPLANMPYNLDELQDADALFAAHTKWQTAVLKEGKKGVPAIKVETGEGERGGEGGCKRGEQGCGDDNAWVGACARGRLVGWVSVVEGGGLECCGLEWRGASAHAALAAYMSDTHSPSSVLCCICTCVSACLSFCLHVCMCVCVSVCYKRTGHGLGNRLPGIGTGFVLAVLTGRLFLLQSTVHEHLRLPLPCVWQVRRVVCGGMCGRWCCSVTSSSILVPGWLPKQQGRWRVVNTVSQNASACSCVLTTLGTCCIVSNQPNPTAAGARGVVYRSGQLQPGSLYKVCKPRPQVLWWPNREHDSNAAAAAVSGVCTADV